MRAILVPFALLAIVIELACLLLRGLGDLRQHITAAIALLLGISVFYLISVFLAFRLTPPVPRKVALFIVACALVFRCTVWPIYPAFSDDVFRYRWEGKLQAAGGNPYQARPNDPQWTGLRDPTFSNVPAKDFKAGYGPLIELGEAAWYRITAAVVPGPVRQVFWFKLPGAALDLVVSGVLLKLLAVRGLRPTQAIVYLWSPLPIFEFWCSGHNDPWMLAPLLAAVVFAIRGRSILAFGCLGLATAAKLWPALLIPLFAAHALARPSPKPRRLLHLAAGLGLFAGILIACFWPYRGNIVENLRFMTGFVGGWRNNDLLFGLLLKITGDLDRAKHLAFALLAVAALVIAGLRWPLERSIVFTVVALLCVSSNCHPWYLVWFLPLLAIHPCSPLLLWTALMPLTYAVLIDWVALGVWNGSTAIRWYVYVPVLAYSLAWWAFLSKKFRASQVL